MLVIGNIIALIGSLVMVYTGILKSKKKILFAQSIQIGLFAISDLILGGISGVVINLINFVRNIICYKNKLGLKEKIFISILSIVLTIYFNNLGFIGYLPLIAGLVYVWLMNTKNVIFFKLLVAFTILLWLIYDFSIKSYTSSIFDLTSIITTFISIIKMKNKKISTVK